MCQIDLGHEAMIDVGGTLSRLGLSSCLILGDLGFGFFFGPILGSPGDHFDSQSIVSSCLWGGRFPLPRFVQNVMAPTSFEHLKSLTPAQRLQETLDEELVKRETGKRKQRWPRCERCAGC